MIYFSIIGYNDSNLKLDSPYTTSGAALTIYKNYLNEIENVVLFTTVTNEKIKSKIDQKFMDAAEKTKKIMEQEKSGIDVQIVELEFVPSPIDYEIVFNEMNLKIPQLISKNKWEEKDKIINISSGTPTMTSCWLLLQQSKAITDATLVQSFPIDIQRKTGSSSQEVKLNLKGFPKIVKADSIQKELVKASTEKEKLSKRVEVQNIHDEFSEFIGKSVKILDIKNQVIDEIDNKIHILITGERGSGKGVLAREIWKRYHKKKEKELYHVNMSELMGSTAQSELFGSKRGAFTDAVDREGLIEEGRDKTIFLDEIGNLKLEGQYALLGLIENGTYKKMGDPKIISIDTQIIAATNKDINDPDKFAQDLKDRFDIQISLPPLREHMDDLPILAEHFITKHSSDNGLLILSDDVYSELLMKYNWPGNVRELEKYIKKLSRKFGAREISYNDIIEGKMEIVMLDDLEEIDLLPALPFPETTSLDEVLNNIQLHYEREALKKHNNIAERAAKDELRIEPHTFRKRIKSRNT